MVIMLVTFQSLENSLEASFQVHRAPFFRPKKRSVVRTLMKRAEVMVTRPDCRRKQMAHVQDALMTNGYKQWMFKVPRPKQQQSITSTGTRPNINVGLPYMQGTSEALTPVFKTHAVGTCHRPINTIRSILVHPKDKTPDAQKCGQVYQVECPKCPLTYIGETGRMLATRMKDHLLKMTESSNNFQAVIVLWCYAKYTFT